MEGESVMNNVMEKLKELLLLLENFGKYLLVKLDEVFPPGTREEKLYHWLKIGVPVGLTVALLLFCFWCCCGCCKRKVRMMKAPGRDYQMPRDVFESDPRSYFQNLRSGDV